MPILHTLQRAAVLRLATLLLLWIGAVAALAQSAGAGPTPPRLSLVEGQVSFWRPGAEAWSVAALNTPLAPGDALYAADNAKLELQIGSRAFVRADERTQLGFVRQERRRIQFRVNDGQASFDLRLLPAGLTVAVDTPHAAITMDRAGYYRLNVDQEGSRFITRRNGRATVVPAGGSVLKLAPAQEVFVAGADTPSISITEAPEPDGWDRWNTERTDELAAPSSARYLPPDVYGADTLDQYGGWREVPAYGTVWVPAGLGPDWAPYSRGQWIWDPFYGWTWIDDVPWGWAPFHYGRWVYLSGFWAWAPGPIAVRPLYAPALVVFFNSGGGVSLSVGAAVPPLSWVALSWGEPLTPWWGPRGFVGKPWWGGWGGPRVGHPARFQNTRVNHAVVTVQHDQFGHGPVRAKPVPASAMPRLTPVPGTLPVKPTASSQATGPVTSVQPPHEVLSRPRAVPPVPRIPHPIVPRQTAPPRPEAAPPRTAAPHEAPRAAPGAPAIHMPLPQKQGEIEKEKGQERGQTPKHHGPDHAAKCDERKGACDR